METAALHGVPRSFDRAGLDRPAAEAAPGLLGALLVREADTTRILARVVEVEAYDEDDPASHSASGRSSRNASMFAAAGTAYVYRSYGLHWCLNVSIGPPGTGAAVLFRAAVPVVGEPSIRARRPRVQRAPALLRGPGCLTAGLDIDGPRHDGLDLLARDGHLLLQADGWRPAAGAVRVGPRVGVTRAAERPWRWYLADEPAVSQYRRSPRLPLPQPDS